MAQSLWMECLEEEKNQRWWLSNCNTTVASSDLAVRIAADIRKMYMCIANVRPVNFQLASAFLPFSVFISLEKLLNELILYAFA